MKKIVFALSLLVIIQTKAQMKDKFINPILAGFYPDPSICRAGDDYYIVNSSFAYFPGLPIFHSKDLVNWTQIGHALDRVEQLDHEGAGVSRGLFAPAISFHNGVFYIVCTQVDKLGNFIITATNPKGPWSDPVALPEINGIDPSLFIEEDGRAYILYNSVPPDNNPLHDGHRTIRMYEFDIERLKVKGTEKLLINGGTDMTKKPVWIEGPHIIRKDGWYYLLCAEGGTGYNHSEVVFRSRSAEGPYTSYEKNPILTQRHLDPLRKNPITTTGHADFVETMDGKWYAVFLGCRPYKDDHYNTGRETFMAPVEWKEGWPVILEANEEVSYAYPLPIPSLTKEVNNNYSGLATYRDEFSQAQLNPRWIFLRTPKQKWYSMSGKKGTLTMLLRPETCDGKGNPSFIAHRQQNLVCEAVTSMQFSAGSENEKAGMLVFQDEAHYYYLCKSLENNTGVIQLYQAATDSSLQLLASVKFPANKKEARLKIEARNDTYAFFYANETGPDQWKLLKDSVDAKFLSTKTAGGFVGSVFALYATSLGKPTNNKAHFNWFEYNGRDEVFKEFKKQKFKNGLKNPGPNFPFSLFNF